MSKNRLEPQENDDETRDILSDEMAKVLDEEISSDDLDTAMEGVGEIAKKANTDIKTVVNIMKAVREAPDRNITMGEKLSQNEMKEFVGIKKLSVKKGDGLLAIFLKPHKDKDGRSIKLLGAMNKNTATYAIKAMERIIKDFKEKLENKSDEFKI